MPVEIITESQCKSVVAPEVTIICRDLLDRGNVSMQ